MNNFKIEIFKKHIYKQIFSLLISIFYASLLIYSNQMWDGSHFQYGLNKIADAFEKQANKILDNS